MRPYSDSKSKASASQWLILGGALLLGLALIFGPLLVRAQDSPHDTSDPAHWYPMECCHAMDCAPVTGTAFSNPIEAGALPNMVITTKHGTVAVPHNFPRRQSKDGRMHACMRPAQDGSMRLICIFDLPGI